MTMLVWQFIEQLEIINPDCKHVGFIDWNTDEWKGACHIDDIDDTMLMMPIKWFQVVKRNTMMVDLYIEF